VQLAQKWQTRRGLALEQQEDHRKVIFLHAAVERFVILNDLPWPDTLFADEQNKVGGLGDRACKLGEPQAPGLQTLWRKKDYCVRVLLPERRLEAVHEPQVSRIVA